MSQQQPPSSHPCVRLYSNTFDSDGSINLSEKNILEVFHFQWNGCTIYMAKDTSVKVSTRCLVGTYALNKYNIMNSVPYEPKFLKGVWYMWGQNAHGNSLDSPKLERMVNIIRDNYFEETRNGSLPYDD